MNNNIFLKPTDELRNYQVLEEIEKNPSISQRDLAKKLNIALGIANSCIHTLIRKGLVKIRGENNRSVTYHLTKKGILHKSVLAFEWTKNTIDFYRQARQQIVSRLNFLSDQGVRKIVLYGISEITEITAIVVRETNLDIINIIDDSASSNEKYFLGFSVNKSEYLDEKPDALIVCVDIDQNKIKVLSEENGENMKIFNFVSSEAFAKSVDKNLNGKNTGVI